ncbi:MAG: hypothetical protein PHP44_11120 [Kiritimatiellae bacterium]|nr:hypothetical protein [Kiritimatiellia bacterium]
MKDEQAQLAFELIRDLGGPKARVVMLKDEMFDGAAIPSTSTIYRFYERYKRQVDEDRLLRAAAAQQSINAAVSSMDDISETMIKGVGFLAVEAIASGDVKAIASLVKQYNGLISTLQAKQEQALAEARFELIKSDKYQAGLAALAEQIKGNAAAQAAFAEFKAVIEGGV